MYYYAKDFKREKKLLGPDFAVKRLLLNGNV